MKSTYRILSVFLILAVMTSIVSLAESSNQINQQINKPIVENMDQVTKLIPQSKPPQGFTEEQIQKAKEVTIKEIEKITKNLTNNIISDNIQSTTQPYGESIYATRTPNIDNQYIVSKYYKCSPCYAYYPSLKIPIKTEIWDDYFRPISGATVGYYLYYWNYYAQNWYELDVTKRSDTDINGISKLGFSIPYKTYSDRYYIFAYVYTNKQPQQFQWSQYFFTVSWY